MSKRRRHSILMAATHLNISRQKTNHIVEVDNGLSTYDEWESEAVLPPNDSADDEENSWNEMFDTLIHFGIQHSHCNVPIAYTAARADDQNNGIPLGQWLARQLELQLLNVLQPDRLQKLQV